MRTNKDKILLEQAFRGEVDLVDLRAKYAEQQTNIVLGNGVSFQATEDKKIQDWYNEFADRQEVEATLWNIVNVAKKHGVAFATIEDLENGEFGLEVAYPQYNNKQAQVYKEAQIAIVYKRPITGDSGTIIKEVWDKDKVVRTAHYKGDEITLDGLHNTKGKQIKRVWKHNLGFVPVFVYKNKPMETFHMGADGRFIYERLSMDFNVRNLEREYNFSARNGIKVEAMTLPLLEATLSPSTLEKAKRNGGTIGVLLEHVHLKNSKVDTNGKTTTGANLIQANLEGEQRDKHLDEIEKRYAKGCGSSFSPETTNISTATEIFYSNSLDEKTANQDIKNIEAFMYQVLDALLKAKGLLPKDMVPSERPYIFQALGNKTLSDIDKLDNAIKKLDAGLTTLEGALIEVNNYSQQEAEQEAKDIREEKEKAQEDAMALMGAYDSLGQGDEEEEENEIKPTNEANKEGDR